IHVNVTLVFSAPQAIIAAKAGASFISPFVGRLDDIGHVGMELIGELVQIFDNYDFQAEILVASVRSPIHVIDAARMGADIATMPFSVITQMLKHPLTDIGNKKFLDDWNAAHSKKYRAKFSARWASLARPARCASRACICPVGYRRSS